MSDVIYQDELAPDPRKPWRELGISPSEWLSTVYDKHVFDYKLILEKSCAFPHTPPAVEGVYFLLNNEEIVYVGRSININIRIRDHSYTNKKFNRIFWIECASPILIDELEPHYISSFNPIYNIEHRSK